MEKPGIEPAIPGLQGIALIHYTTAASLLFCGFPWYKPVPPGWFKLCWFYNGNTQRLTESGFMEKPGIEPATPGLQGIALIHYTTAASLLFFLFCGFSMGRNQYWAGRVYDLCVYYMMGTPEGSTESGFMEKPGIEPATPGLQGIVLIHYTTGVSLLFVAFLGINQFRRDGLRYVLVL